MARLLLLTEDLDPTREVLPALGLLAHEVRRASPTSSSVVAAADYQAVLVDARRDLSRAKATSRMVRTAAADVPILVTMTEGGLVALSAEWEIDDVLLDNAGPAEVDARLRLAMGRAVEADDGEDDTVTLGDLVIDEASYAARLRGQALDLTYKEFELLKYLAQHPGRVFTRAQLLQEVWGYDYFGGTRTVDVHVRRLRAKLGSDHEVLIGTVRNVGYRLVPDAAEELTEPEGAV